MAHGSDRLHKLLAAGIALSSELSLEALLQRVVETAADVAEARYAALGVIDPSGQHLERFLTHGVDAETHRAIGDLPRGRGILGVLIRDAEPLRLERIADDPRSVGFPEHHPPMTTFLGVPIKLRDVAYGNLYLAEKAGGGPFTAEDEEAVHLLAGQAAVAIENARLYESSTRWLRRFETLNEIGNALASEIDLDRVLDLVTARLRELVDARLVLIALPDVEQGTVSVAAAAGDATYGIAGMQLPLLHSKIGRVLERGQSERVDSLLDDPEVDQVAARRLGATTGLFVPLTAKGRPLGVLVAHDRHGSDPRFSHEDLRLAEALSARASLAVDLSRRVSRDAVRRVVEAQELERKRLARELHDETGQALTSILLGLKPLERVPLDDDGRAAVQAVRELVVSTLQDVRRLAVELRPSALDDFGLVPAVERLAGSWGDNAGIEVALDLRLDGERLPGDVETAVYRIVQEALTNVSKHADATRVSIGVWRGADSVTATVADDGRGFSSNGDGDGLGIVGMRERVALLGGRLRLESAPGEGTRLVAELPLRGVARG